MIQFEAGTRPVPSIDIALVSRWIERVAEAHSFRVGNIIYRFCDDEDILQHNRRFVNHDYYTDIITFDYTRDDVINGDVLVGLDTVASNAELLGVPYERELLRVIIHGVLHLCGINDKGEGEREIMEAHENDALHIYDALKSE